MADLGDLRKYINPVPESDDDSGEGQVEEQSAPEPQEDGGQAVDAEAAVESGAQPAPEPDAEPGETEAVSAEPGETPDVKAEPGETPEANAKPGETPDISAEPSETGDTEAEVGTTPDAEAEPGNTEDVQAEPGTTEDIAAESGETPPVAAEVGETPDANAEPGVTEDVQAEPSTTEEVQAESGETPPVDAEVGETPDTSAEGGETPEVAAEPSETPETSAEPGETPEASAEPGETPEASAEPGETPDAEAEPAETPEVEAEPGDFPKIADFDLTTLDDKPVDPFAPPIEFMSDPEEDGGEEFADEPLADPPPTKRFEPKLLPHQAAAAASSSATENWKANGISGTAGTYYDVDQYPWGYADPPASSDSQGVPAGKTGAVVSLGIIWRAISGHTAGNVSFKVYNATTASLVGSPNPWGIDSGTPKAAVGGTLACTLSDKLVIQVTGASTGTINGYIKSFWVIE